MYENTLLKIMEASKEIDVTLGEYFHLLNLLQIKPIPPAKDKSSKGNYMVSVDVHEKVKHYLEHFVALNSGKDIVNENKDFLKAMELFENEMKNNKSIPFVKRKGVDYYTKQKLVELENIIEEVNKKIESSRIILGNGYELVKLNAYYEATYFHSKNDYLPKLRIRNNDKYGYQIFLKYYVIEEILKDGKIVKTKREKQLTGLLNRTAEIFLYWSALLTAVFIYNKIKLGYFIKFNLKAKSNFNVIMSTPPNELYLIPTLLAYLDYFKKREFKTLYASSLQGNLNHLIRFLHPHISTNEEIKYDEITYSMKFIDFGFQKVTKFIEYLKSTKTLRTNKPATGRTITNIISNLGNLVTKILKQHEPPFKNYTNPFLKHDIRVEKRQMHPIYSSEQLKKLIEKIRLSNDIQLLTLVYVMYYSGCRRIEAERLKIGNIELAAGKIRFYKLIEGGRTKTTNRTITLHPDLKKILMTQGLGSYNKEDFLFSSKGVPGATQVSHNYFQKRFQKLRIHIPELSEKHGLYGLKHTFCTNFLKASKSKEELEARKIQLMEILGHQSFRETMTYITGLDLSDLFPQRFDGLQRLEDQARQIKRS